jgi:hypothetical protein
MLSIPGLLVVEATHPIWMFAFRVFTNQRGEFLLKTLPTVLIATLCSDALSCFARATLSGFLRFLSRIGTTLDLPF